MPLKLGDYTPTVELNDPVSAQEPVAQTIARPLPHWDRSVDGAFPSVLGAPIGRPHDRPVAHASFGARAAAAIVDAIIIQVVAIAINMVFLGALLSHINATSVFLASVGPLAVGGAFTLFYCVWLECSPWQATFGKRLLGLKVVDLNHQRISFGKSSWRNVSKGLSALTLGIGYLMPLWDHRGQALHDKATGCLVIRDR